MLHINFLSRLPRCIQNRRWGQLHRQLCELFVQPFQLGLRNSQHFRDSVIRVLAIFTAKTSTTAALANQGLVILPAGKLSGWEHYWGVERGIVFRPGVVAGYPSVEERGSSYLQLRPIGFPRNYGVPRQHCQITLEYPMGPLRHGEIGPIHISTMGQLCRCVFNISSACHSFYLQSVNPSRSSWFRLIPILQSACIPDFVRASRV